MVEVRWLGTSPTPPSRAHTRWRRDAALPSNPSHPISAACRAHPHLKVEEPLIGSLRPKKTADGGRCALATRGE